MTRDRPERLVALIDESFRVVRGGHYLMAAALVRASDLEDVRVVLRATLPSSIAHFRWAKENDGLRDAMIDAAAGLRLAAIVVVATPVAPRRQERARALCLERLAWELSSASVDRMLLESRGAQDPNDRRVLAGLQRRRIIPATLTYDFATKDDPALWLPDAIAGAVMMLRCEDSDRFAARLNNLRVIEVPYGAP